MASACWEADRSEVELSIVLCPPIAEIVGGDALEQRECELYELGGDVSLALLMTFPTGPAFSEFSKADIY